MDYNTVRNQVYVQRGSQDRSLVGLIQTRRTGTWPRASIAIHVINWVVILFGGGFLIWWTAEHHLSRWRFLGIFLLIGLPYGVVENWAKRRVKLNHLRNRKRPAKQLD